MLANQICMYAVRNSCLIVGELAGSLMEGTICLINNNFDFNMIVSCQTTNIQKHSYNQTEKSQSLISRQNCSDK